MSRFIDLDIAHVNVDYITRVEGHPDGSAEVYMIDGTMFRCPQFFWDDLEGSNYVTSVIPCTNMEAQFEKKGEFKWVPVDHLAVTAAGQVYPLIMFTTDYEAEHGCFCELREIHKR